MRLTMKVRSSVVRVVASRYQKGGKKHKGNILKEFMELTAYNRCYAAYLLRSHGKRIRISKGYRSRRRYYKEGREGTAQDI